MTKRNQQPPVEAATVTSAPAPEQASEVAAAAIESMPEAPPPPPAAPPSPPAPAAAAPEEEDLSPRAHAIATGNAARPRRNGLTAVINGNRVAIGSRPRGSWQHEAASMLHGWTEHQHHSPGQKPIQLTREDYLAALKAAETTNEAGNYVPHKPALSPHKGKGL